MNILEAQIKGLNDTFDAGRKAGEEMAGLKWAARVSDLESGLNKWISANAPGGWIDDLRKNAERVKILEDAIFLSREAHDIAERELAACKVDAHRYRWLRGDEGPPSKRWPRWKLEEFTKDGWAPRSAKELDTAIDAALAAAKETGEKAS